MASVKEYRWQAVKSHMKPVRYVYLKVYVRSCASRCALIRAVRFSTLSSPSDALEKEVDRKDVIHSVGATLVVDKLIEVSDFSSHR